ncbi:MAG: energy-coupling factor transporter ATPase [Firmicutes bacterium]|nr:energy-coupling factor transporter ATPase [Bacillota bacterium]
MPIIEMDNVSFAYGSGEEITPVLEGFSLSIEEGAFVALVGRNGSGKSTLARLFNALKQPDAGVVKVDGLDTDNGRNVFKIRKTVGVVFQNPDNQMVATLVEDDLAFGPQNLGLPPEEIEARIDWALEAVGMSGHRRSMPHRLSGGQKQRIAIAGVLAIKPRVIVLDESTSMLDPQGRREVLDVVKRLNKEDGMGVIMITHFMEEAAEADRIIVLDKGKIILDGGREIFEESDKLLEAGLDVPPFAGLANELRGRGIALGRGVVTAEELVEELCKLR